MKLLPVVVVALVVIAAMLFVPILRRVVSLLVRLAIFFIGLAVAGAGAAMILNNETIFERPGIEYRVLRFVTMNSAAASASGSGSVTCDMGEGAKSQPQASPTPAAKKRGARKLALSNEPERPTRLEPTGTPAPLEDIYPELIRRSFPGIPRQKLFDLSEQTIDSLGGWKIVKKDPGSYTLDCIYTSRIFKWEDDVRISIEPSGEIDVCSRSGTARPDSTSMLRYVPFDLGANVGHIKEFYETLEPKMDEVYEQQQEKENAKKPPAH
jgi:Protein of unknown function (DUF1499)